MNASRINTSVFLAACLGLLIAGAPVEVHSRQSATQLAQHGTSFACLGLGASAVSSLQVHWNPASEIKLEPQSTEILYQNTKALIENNQVLIVTRLPRAGLSDSPAKPLMAI